MGWFDDSVNAVRSVAAPVVDYARATAMFNPSTYLANQAVTGGLNSIGLGGGGGGGESQPSSPLMGANSSARNADMNAGYAKGQELFYDDPDMKALRDRRTDLAKGYNGQELGAMREQARSELAGQRVNAQRSLQGNAARAGVGGARAAAMGAAADVNLNKNAAEMERKMTLDNANLTRQGTNDMQDFLMRQKYGMLGTGLGYGQLGVADRSADAQAAIAGKEQDRGIVGNLLKPLFG